MKQAKLPSPYALVNTIQQALPEFVSVNWLDQIDSTNAFLLQQARGCISDQRPSLVGAHHQTKGKGRGGRAFKDLDKTTLMFSCAFDVYLPAVKLPMLAPLAGIVACEQLREIVDSSTQARLSMKWPNDILFDDAKLSGLLVESVRSANAARNTDHYIVVVGMGLNLNQAQTLSKSLQRKIADWTSVLDAVHLDRHASAHDVGLMVARIANAWHSNIKLYEQFGFEPFIARHKAIDALLNQPINVLDGDKILFHGVAQGLNEQACLKVQTASGLKYVFNGDISIRPYQAEDVSL